MSDTSNSRRDFLRTSSAVAAGAALVAAAKPLLGDDVSAGRCPFLHESLVQYCGAASLTKYIPYSEAVLSHCGTESHRYCELFLAFAHPGAAAPAETAHPDTGETVEGVRSSRADNSSPL